MGPRVGGDRVAPHHVVGARQQLHRVPAHLLPAAQVRRRRNEKPTVNSSSSIIEQIVSPGVETLSPAASWNVLPSRWRFSSDGSA